MGRCGPGARDCVGCSTPGSTWSTAPAASVAACPGRALCRDCRDRFPSRSLRVRPTPCPAGWPPASRRGTTTGCWARWWSRTRNAPRSPSPARSAWRWRRPRAVLDPGARVLVPVPSRPRRGPGPGPRPDAAGRAGWRPGSCAAPGSSSRWPRLLEQRRAVADQVGLGSEQRAANLSGSMRVRSAPARGWPAAASPSPSCSATTSSRPAPPPARRSAPSRTGSACGPS